MLVVDVVSNFISRPMFPQNKLDLPSIYKTQLNDPENPQLDIQKYEGKKLIIVNTASQCSFTRQYKDLQRVFTNQKNHLNVVAFPCNDFGNQENKSNEDIKSFCSATFNVEFKVFNKITVKGKNISPLFHWLSSPELNGWNKNRPLWNFWKYILNESGQLTAVIPSVYTITEENLIKWKI